MTDGSVKVFRMTKGKERDLIEFEQIGKNGKAKKLASDGIIQMSDSYDYDRAELFISSPRIRVCSTA